MFRIRILGWSLLKWLYESYTKNCHISGCLSLCLTVEDFPAWLGPTWSFWSSSTWTARAASWFITWRWNHRAPRTAPSVRISRTGFWCGPAWWCIQWSAIGPSWRRVFSCCEGCEFLGATPKIPAWEHLPFFPNGSNAPIQTSSVNIINISHFAIPSFFPKPTFSSGVFISGGLVWQEGLWSRSVQQGGPQGRPTDFWGLRGGVHRGWRCFRGLPCIGETTAGYKLNGYWSVLVGPKWDLVELPGKKTKNRLKASKKPSGLFLWRPWPFNFDTLVATFCWETFWTRQKRLQVKKAQEQSSVVEPV